MKAVIFCGGLGTRIREETEFKPKPMVEIGGRPVLWHIMKIYAHHGISDFILCAGYKQEVIKDYFLNYEALSNDFTIRLGARHEIEFHSAHLESSWKVTIADTGPDTQTAGRLAAVKRYLEGEDDFCVTYGDGVADVDIPGSIAFHERHGRVATVTTVKIPSRFGVLDMQDSGHVASFSEKAVTDGWVNGGFFIFNKRVFDYLPDDVPLEREPLVHLAKDGELMAWQHNGFWQPMDTYRESKLLNDMWDSGDAPWKVWRD